MDYKRKAVKNSISTSKNVSLSVIHLRKLKQKIKLLCIFLIIISILPQNNTRRVSCDEIGMCKIVYDNGNEFIPKPFGINLNFFYDKYSFFENLEISLKFFNSIQF